MACPTCDHTAEGIGHGMFHCPRCGTLLNCPTAGSVHVPALVRRCRDLLDELIARHAGFFPDDVAEAAHRLGVNEAIYLPSERPAG